VTIDKPPLASGSSGQRQLFGFSGVSLLLPEGLAGCSRWRCCTNLVQAVFRPAGGAAGGAVPGAHPGGSGDNRNNTIDSILVLFMLLGAWAVSRAVERRRAGSGRGSGLRWLLCAVLVGRASTSRCWRHTGGAGLRARSTCWGRGGLVGTPGPSGAVCGGDAGRVALLGGGGGPTRPANAPGDSTSTNWRSTWRLATTGLIGCLGVAAGGAQPRARAGQRGNRRRWPGTRHHPDNGRRRRRVQSPFGNAPTGQGTGGASGGGGPGGGGPGGLFDNGPAGPFRCSTPNSVPGGLAAAAGGESAWWWRAAGPALPLGCGRQAAGAGPLGCLAADDGPASSASRDSSTATIW